MFARYVFQLRAAADLPTVYISSADSAFIYKNGKTATLAGVIKVRLLQNVLRWTWVIVDSNTNLINIPQEVIDSGLFVLQAAPPRKDYFTAANKLVDKAQICVMQPWTAWELVVGYVYIFDMNGRASSYVK